MLQTNGFDMGQEEERLKQEGGGIQTPAVNTPEKTEQEGKPGKPGRPPLDDAERNSDPAKSFTGKQPKPSNPEGSLPD